MIHGEAHIPSGQMVFGGGDQMTIEAKPLPKEGRLVAAIMLRAIEDVLGVGPEAAKWTADARKYFFGRGCMLEEHCETLGLDPDHVRRTVRVMIREHKRSGVWRSARGAVCCSLGIPMQRTMEVE